MKFCKVFLLALVSIALCVPCVMASEKGSGGYEKKGSSDESGSHKGSYKTSIEAQGVAVSGKMFFSDYYSMGGEKCAAFLEAEDGSLFCVLDNIKVNELKGEMGRSAGRVKVKGSMIEDEHGRYLKVEEYEVKDKKGTPKGSATKKGSGNGPKGSRR